MINNKNIEQQLDSAFEELDEFETSTIENLKNPTLEDTIEFEEEDGDEILFQKNGDIYENLLDVE
jgi:hypothetical protein